MEGLFPKENMEINYPQFTPEAVCKCVWGYEQPEKESGFQVGPN